jgi:hypothetical protein
MRTFSTWLTTLTKKELKGLDENRHTENPSGHGDPTPTASRAKDKHGERAKLFQVDPRHGR